MRNERDGEMEERGERELLDTQHLCLVSASERIGGGAGRTQSLSPHLGRAIMLILVMLRSWIRWISAWIASTTVFCISKDRKTSRSLQTK